MAETGSEPISRNLEPQPNKKPKLLLLGWGNYYDEIQYHPRCAPIPLSEYYELLADAAEVVTLDDMECVRPDICCRLDNSLWWQNPVFAHWLGRFDIIIDSISWLAPYFEKKTYEYKPLFRESITRLLVPGGRFIGYDNPWFVATRITPLFLRISERDQEYEQQRTKNKQTELIN